MVSLENDVTTKQKVEMNIRINPNTLFLTSSNKTADIINKMVLEILFTNMTLLGDVIDGNKNPIQIYKIILSLELEVGKKFSVLLKYFH